MADDALEVNLGQHVLAIRLCLQNHLRIPALALIYTGIDVMANLAQMRKERADRHDFQFWAEKYMDCENRIGVSGKDLYAARCGVVHTYTADSSLAAAGHACRIYYTWGDKKADAPNAVLKALGRPEKMVKIEALFAAFTEGVAAFLSVLDQEPAMAAQVRAKARRFFMNSSAFPGVSG